jgi:hypothetical protein
MRFVDSKRDAGFGGRPGAAVDGVSMSIKKASQQNHEGNGSSTSDPSPEGGLDQVRLAIKGVRYGEIRVIIQDYVIVQIERVEKQRIL